MRNYSNNSCRKNQNTILCFITLFEIRAVILVKYVCGLNFPDRFSKNTQISNLMKIRPVGAKLFHANRRTNGQTDLRN